MQKLQLYAIHTDGRKLFCPQWDAAGEIINTRKPTAAVTIDQNGVTFPPGSVWIRKPRSAGLKEGWNFAEAVKGKKPENQVPENNEVTDHTMLQNQVLQR
jgi:hypothetical protein